MHEDIICFMYSIICAWFDCVKSYLSDFDLRQHGAACHNETPLYFDPNHSIILFFSLSFSLSQVFALCCRFFYACLLLYIVDFFVCLLCEAIIFIWLLFLLLLFLFSLTVDRISSLLQKKYHENGCPKPQLSDFIRLFFCCSSAICNVGEWKNCLQIECECQQTQSKYSIVCVMVTLERWEHQQLVNNLYMSVCSMRCNFMKILWENCINLDLVVIK